MAETADEVGQALVTAARSAGHAPSIHNTQPWRWLIRDEVLELHADKRRHLPALDPDAHLLLISCGAALHHARLALDAEGWRYTVTRPATDPLATVHTTGRGRVDPAAMRRFQLTLVRHTDRRPVAPDPVDPTALAAVIRAAGAEGVHLHVLRPGQLFELAAAVDGAMRAEADDDRQRTEISRWVGGDRPEGTGVPDSAIPVRTPQTTVPSRNFGVVGTLPVDARHDAQAVYAVLYGAGDDPVDWLRAGEALSAAWIDAVDHGLTMLPISAPVEIVSTRDLLRQMIAEVGYPYIVVRIGAADPEHAGPPHTPRLSAAQTIEVA